MQSFFEFMVDKKVLRRVSQARGRFRAFLLAALHNHWADLRDHDNAIKRGGGERMGSLDETDEDGKPIHEAVEIAAPDTEFDRDWALNLLRRVITRLESEYTAGGKADLFTHLQSFLYGDPDAMTHKQAADVLRISHEAVRIAGHRLRKRYQELIHLEIRDTVQSEADVADELQLLFAALRGRRG